MHFLQPVRLLLLITLTACLGACSPSDTVYTQGFSEEAFAKIVPEMTTDEVLDLIGEPFSRNFQYSSANSILVYHEDEATATSGQPQTWRYSQQGSPGKKWHIWQIVVDPKVGKVMITDSYISPRLEVTR